GACVRRNRYRGRTCARRRARIIGSEGGCAVPSGAYGVRRNSEHVCGIRHARPANGEVRPDRAPHHRSSKVCAKAEVASSLQRRSLLRLFVLAETQQSEPLPGCLLAFKPCGLFLNPVPRTLHVPPRSVRLSHAEAKRESVA